MSALAFWQSLSSPSRCSLGICQLFSTSPSPPSTAAGPTGPSIAQGAPLVGLGSTPAVEDLPLGHLGWCGHRDRTASAASATAAAFSTAAVSTAVSTAITTAHRRPPGTPREPRGVSRADRSGRCQPSVAWVRSNGCGCSRGCGWDRWDRLQTRGRRLDVSFVAGCPHVAGCAKMKPLNVSCAVPYESHVRQ